MDIHNTSNMFIAIANARARAGEDMEQVAHELAIAFQAVVLEGLGEGSDTIAEYDRLRKSPYEPLPPNYSKPSGAQPI